MKTKTVLFIVFPLLSIFCTGCDVSRDLSLKNDRLKVTFAQKGIQSVYDIQNGLEVQFGKDEIFLTIDSVPFETAKMIPGKIRKTNHSVSYIYSAGEYSFTVKYELQDNWRFVSKQVLVDCSDKTHYRVNEMGVMAGQITNDSLTFHRFPDRRYGFTLRNVPASSAEMGNACFFTVQNPYSEYIFQEGVIQVKYDPQMKWEQRRGPFESDRLCIGIADLTGHTFRADLLPEWEYVPRPDEFVAEGDRIDQGEIDAMTQCAREFLMIDPQESVQVHIGWCENDYQIDIATPEGMEEYKRIIDQAVELGNQHVLFTPFNSAVAPLEENTDAWGWESLLWWNMGQKIRKGEWHPGDPLPPTVQEVVDYARSKGIGLMAYVYPSLPFMQNPEWTAWRTSNGKKPEGYLTVDTGLESFQDWLVDMLVAFAEATGCTGYSFDHWWIAYENDPEDTNVQVSSKYQQWYGCRRVLEQLRKRAPHLVIDGRQQYHHFGTWTWLAGTYPHPMMSDEQPGSFMPITDLSTDRVSGARQRYVAYRLMTRDFTPVEILPGFITHQTQRNDAARVMRRDRFRSRDWDYLGWKYNLISSLATAPINNVVNYIPARDEQEFHAFSEEDKAFFNQWLDFTNRNMEYLKHVRPILGQPMTGRCDGTAAIVEDRGFIFLFNPNYREMQAVFNLDRSIGLTSGEKFTLKELYPREGVILGPGISTYGDRICLDMPGITAKVLKIEPFEENGQPLLVNVPGDAQLEQDKLILTNVTGAAGSEAEIAVILPQETHVTSLIVNGTEVEFAKEGNRVEATLRFAGKYFPKSASLTVYDPEFTGTMVETTLHVPERIFEQLEKRKEKWPVSYTDDDRLAPWLEPSRLLLYIQVADPYRLTEEEVRWGDEVMTRRIKKPFRKDEYRLEIDGKPFPLQEAYNGVYPYMERTFLGIYSDISSLEPGVDHKVRVTLPEGLKPGQFQGIFVEHVEDEYTETIIK
ncbi:MAG TPA: hypothetical protein ENN63_10395 [Bacteroidetes bacterium]|nr:hypothetical protein [Bacteroidota bacterium]